MCVDCGDINEEEFDGVRKSQYSTVVSVDLPGGLFEHIPEIWHYHWYNSFCSKKYWGVYKDLLCLLQCHGWWILQISHKNPCNTISQTHCVCWMLLIPKLPDLRLFPQLPMYQDFWIISFKIKGILLCEIHLVNILLRCMCSDVAPIKYKFVSPSLLSFS